MARSNSVACPIDSWIVSHRLVGSMTRSYWPASTDGDRDLLGQQTGHRFELGVPVPSLAQQVLPPPARRRCDGAHGLEAAIGVDGERLDDGVDPDPQLGGFGPGQVGVVLVLGDCQHLGGDVVHRVRGQQASAPLGQESDLFRQRN